MIEIKKQIQESEWKRFLNGCEKATLYHTPEWKTFLEETFGYRSHYLFATDDSGQMIGMLPLFHIKSWLTGNRLCSVPFSHECGFLGPDMVCKVLSDEAIAIASKHNVDTIEIRSAVENPMFHGKIDFCTHILELSQNPEDTWKRIDRGSARWAVKKAEKLGVSVVSSTNRADLKRFYELNCITKKNLGVPCHPWKFFKNLFTYLDGYVKMYLSQYQGNIIAGGVIESYKGQVLYGYGAADPNRLDLYPYNAFIWKSIEDACLNGYQSYDFGRTSFDNKGLIQFKERWGTHERGLCYSFYPSLSKPGATNRSSSFYRFGNSVLRAMPISAYRAFSASVFSHFG